MTMKQVVLEDLEHVGDTMIFQSLIHLKNILETKHREIVTPCD